MKYLVGYAVAFLACRAAFGQDASPPDPGRLQQYAPKLSRRQEAVENVTARIRKRSEPTPGFVASYAKDTGKDPAKVLAQFSHDSESQYTAMIDGRFLYDELKSNKSGTKHRMIFAYDNVNSWRMNNDLANGDWLSWDVEIDGQIPSGYRNGGVLCSILGIRSTTLEKSLLDEIREGGQVGVDDASDLDGVRCLKISWQVAGPSNSMVKTTVWFDVNRGFALLRLLKQEMSASGTEKDWRTVQTWETKGLDRTNISDPSGKKEKAEFWYPKSVVIDTYNKIGKTFTETIEITKISLNEKLDTRIFTPALEDGSNMIDKKTNRVWVYGSGPSPRLKGIVDRRIGETKRLISESLNQAPAAIRTPPRDLWGYASIAALALASSGVLTICFLKVKGAKG